MDVNIANSEWSNGCESGWTVYLEESYITRNDNVSYHPSQGYRLKSAQNDEDDDDEDLSMVSDASSGPPHFQVQEDDQQSYSRLCYSTNSEKSSKKSAKKSSKQHKKISSHNKQHQHQHQHQPYHHLDDTASSPAISTSSQIYANPSHIGFSQNFSATHLEGSSSYNNHYSFWQSSHVQDADYSAIPGQLSGRGWE